MSSIDSLFCWSLSARDGDPVEVREAATLPMDDWSASPSRLATGDGQGLLYLGTCHRVELYGFGVEPEAALEAWSGLRKGHSFQPRLTTGVEALRRLIRVTSSLESEVLGETQVTGQVKDALDRDRKLGFVKGPLDRIIQFALNVSKRVRSQTRLGEGTVSVAHVAVDGLNDVFDSLESRAALVIGAGPMAEQALIRLRRNGIGAITWVNRTRERIESHELAAHCRIEDFHKRHELMWNHSIVVAATSSAEPVLRTSQLGACRQWVKQTVHGPQVVLDLGLPRNVDESLHGFQNFYVRNVDEFSTRIRENSDRRRRELADAEKIVQESVAEFLADFDRRSKGSKIGELFRLVEQARQLDLAQNDVEKNEEIDYLTRSFSAKLLHRLVQELESLSTTNETVANQVLDTLLRAWRHSDQWPLKSQSRDPLEPHQNPKENPPSSPQNPRLLSLRKPFRKP